MKIIRSLFQKIRTRNALYLQLLLVVIAFVLMIVSSGLYVKNMLQDDLRNDTADILAQTKLKIETKLTESQTALSIVQIEHIGNFVANMSLTQGSYGILIDEKLDILYHPESQITGRNIREFDGGFLLLANEAEKGNNLFEQEVKNYKNIISAGFSTRLANNWVLCAIIPKAEYYRNLNNLMLILGIMGTILAALLCLVLININKTKDKAVEENHQKGMQLALIEKMRETDERAQLMLDTAPLCVDFWDNNYNLIACNEEAVRLFGLNGKQEYLDRFYELSPEYQPCGKSSKEKILEAVKKTFEEGYFRFEWIQQKPDGEQIPCEMILMRVRFKGEDTVLGYTRDLRELKAALAAAQETDRRIQLMLDAMPLVTTFWDFSSFWDKDPTNRTCNEETIRLFELKDRQEYFDRFNELSPEYQPCGRLSEELATEYIIQTYKEGYHRFEWVHQKPNGEPVPCEVTLVRIKYKEDFAIAGYIRDLREYKQMINKIEQRDNLLNTMNQTAVMLLAAENEGNMTASILKGMELLGRAVDVDRVRIWQNEIIDDTLNFVHKYEWLSEIGQQKKLIPIDAKIPYSSTPQWADRFLRGEHINSTFSKLPQSDRDFLHPHGIQSIVIIPLFLQDNFWGFFSLDDCRKERIFPEEDIDILRSGGLLITNAFLHNDMTQNIRNSAVQLEAALNDALEANAAKSRFLTTMSHEIRTPMNVILGITENQLLDESHSEDMREAFEKIYNSGDLLMHIINDILDLSKIEAGKLELLPAKYEMVSLISDIVNTNITQFGYKRLEFRLLADENIPLYLYGDELRIKQILNNILSNAFKYTNIGEVVLSFAIEEAKEIEETENLEENKTVLAISVSDTGQGMTPEQIDKMFDEYTRFNLEANRATAGTGLGMTITHNLIKMMGGQFWVDSTPGMGTMFTVHIPQETIGSEVLGLETAKKLQSFHFTNQMRGKQSKITREPMPYGKVLVVDDMPSNMDVAKLLLKPYGLQIDTAESGFEAIDLIKDDNEYDIIFMDHMMPGMDGMETAQRLRELGYKHPVIALTANVDVGQKDIFLANGFDGYISKPIDIRQLNDSLNKFIRNKEHTRQLEPDQSVFHAYIDGEASVFQTINIPGVDTEAGLALYDDEDIYISILRSFLSNVLAIIEKLRNVSGESLPEYTINVHGLNSISANIGAKKLSKAAYDLETKGKSGNLPGVLAGNDSLLKDAETLASNVRVWLEEYDKKSPKPRLPNPDRLLLVQLRESCEAYDMNGIDEAIDRLESADYENDASLVPWLREAIDALDFSSIISRLSKYLEDTK